MVARRPRRRLAAMNGRAIGRSPRGALAAICLGLTAGVGCRAAGPAGAPANRADRIEWFRDQGFGMFIHWGVDVQLGVVISHSLPGASDDYKRMFFERLPATFNAKRFDPGAWAQMAGLAGMRYVVFSAKHHSGFCMWETRTTDFNVMRTPLKRDVVTETLEAFRARGVAAGLYFSPDDFLWLDRNGIDIQRDSKLPGIQPTRNPGLMALNLEQMRELMTGYGRVDVVFLDGEAERLRDLIWATQPEAVVTRGAMATPEKSTPGKISDMPWEACHAMGHGWGYQPFDEYKSPGKLILDLIEIRAKGGNLLLNVGPRPDGELPIEQEERLREIGLWMAVNGEAIYGVRPWVVAGEPNVWFTRKKDSDTVYAFLVQGKAWPLGEPRDFVLKNVRATAGTEVSVLGQNDRVLEYQATVPKTTWRQEADGLHVRVTHAQRLRDNRTWGHPVVLKVTRAAAPAASLVAVQTMGAERLSPTSARLLGRLEKGGGEAKTGFDYRDITGMDADERTSRWQSSNGAALIPDGSFTVVVEGLKTNAPYEYRAKAKVGDQSFYGQELELRAAE